MNDQQQIHLMNHFALDLSVGFSFFFFFFLRDFISDSFPRSHLMNHLGSFKKMLSEAMNPSGKLVSG